MLEGLYSAAAGMAAPQRRMEALANDVANVNTNGYKRVRLGFRDLAYQAAGRGALANVTTGSGSASAAIGRGAQQGPLRTTDEPLDLAIEGPGYFQVRRPDGTIALTRDGQFKLDARGRVVNAQGSPLAPPIDLPRGADVSRLSINPDGRVTLGRRLIGQITVVTVQNPDGLASVGDNLLVPTARSGAPAAAGAGRIAQGALEASNVDLADAMVDMMDAQRSFELASKAIQMQDQMMEVANRVKR